MRSVGRIDNGPLTTRFRRYAKDAIADFFGRIPNDLCKRIVELDEFSTRELLFTVGINGAPCSLTQQQCKRCLVEKLLIDLGCKLAVFAIAGDSLFAII